jgi:hypothetical protein
MTPKNLLLAAVAFAAVSAFAQQSIGTVSNVQGVVTATQGGTGVTVTPGTPIQNGMRFVTTSSGSVTLQLNSGCTVTVPPNSGVTVLSSMTCQQLVAAVQPVTPVAAQTPFGPGPGADAIIPVVGAAIAAGIIYESTNNNNNNNNNPVSPQ